MRRSRHTQSGMTMIEISVVLLIFSIVMSGLFAAFMTFQRTADEVDNRVENTGEAQKLISALSKDVRTATPLTAGTSPFLLAGTRRMTFYGDLNYTTGVDPRFPNKIDLLIDTTNPAAPVLKEYIWVPTNNASTTASAPTYNTAATSLRLVGQYVANAATDPIFHYYDDAGVEIPPTVPSGTPTSLAAADQIRVRTIGIALSVRKQSIRSVSPTRVETTVRLPNVIYGNLTAS